MSDIRFFKAECPECGHENRLTCSSRVRSISGACEECGERLHHIVDDEAGVATLRDAEISDAAHLATFGFSR